MKKEIKEMIENLVIEKENLAKENENLFKEYKNLKLDLHKELTKNIKLNKVLEQLIIAICYSEDEKLLKTTAKIFKDIENIGE